MSAEEQACLAAGEPGGVNDGLHAGGVPKEGDARVDVHYVEWIQERGGTNARQSFWSFGG